MKDTTSRSAPILDTPLESTIHYPRVLDCKTQAKELPATEASGEQPRLLVEMFACLLDARGTYYILSVIAVLVGGISILAGHITAEQLTKFVLYSEWLIYSTWWVGDSLSSLMQSVGASEKVFQLMDLGPSGQFIDKGDNVSHMLFQLTSHRLNGKNYLEWAQSIKLAIDGRGKLGHLTGETKKPKIRDPRMNTWKSENS
ncbi:hypothetical protein FXO37_25356 [Capsicum annuum]|nr:hypothetical protein FXO37_25356 [Capsicum annuum]